MSVSQVSSNSNAAQPVFQDNTGKIIKQLEAQKVRLQDQIKGVNDSKLDEKLKQERIKELQNQIQQIDAAISQVKAEQLNRNINKQKENQPSDCNKDTESTSEGGMPDLLQVNSSYSQIKKMNSIKTGLKNSAVIMKREIEEDEARSLSGGKATAKRKELVRMESRERDIDVKAGQKIHDIHSQVTNVTKKEMDKVEEEKGRDKAGEDEDKAKKKKRIDILI